MFQGFLLTMMILLGHQALAASVLCNRVFEVGTNTEAVANKGPAINDFSAALFAEIKRRVPCVFNERNLSFSKGLDELRKNRIDIYAFVFDVPSWNEVANPETIYSVSRILLINKKFYKEGLTVADYLKNPKIKFATISGKVFFTSNEEIKILEKGNRIVYTPFPDGALELVRDGKAQAAFTSLTYYRQYVKQFGLAQSTRMIEDKNHPFKLALFFSKKRVSPDEQKLFAKAIKDMSNDGTLRRLLLSILSEEDLKKYYRLKE